MSKLIYLSGGWNDHETIIQYAEKLTPLGYDIAHDWPWQARLQAAQDATAGPSHVLRGDSHLTNEERFRHATEEVEAVKTADFFWLFVASYTGSAGSWFETGYASAIADITRACGRGRPIILVSGPNARKSIFTSLVGPMCFATHDEAFEVLKREPLHRPHTR